MKPAAYHRARRPSTGTDAGAGCPPLRRSAATVNRASTVSATAEVPYCTSWNTGYPPASRLSTGTSRTPHRSWWVNASQTTCVAAPMTADATNQAPSRTPHGPCPGPRWAPRTSAYTRP